MTILLVVIGAATGAPLRYLTDRWVRARRGLVFPWGTFIVNVTGSGLLGFLAALPGHGSAATVTGAAFCGAFTTFSTFGYETLKLVEERAYLFATLNVVASVAAALAAAYAGMTLAQVVTG